MFASDAGRSASVMVQVPLYIHGYGHRLPRGRVRQPRTRPANCGGFFAQSPDGAEVTGRSSAALVIQRLSTIFLALSVLTGLLMTHAVAFTHLADEASSTPTAAAATAITVDATAESSSAVAPRCSADDNSECCVEPAECVETVTVIPPVFAAVATPIPGGSISRPSHTALTGQAETSRPVSLMMLSISRT